MNSINLLNGLLTKGETEIINSEMNEVIIPEIQIPEDNKKYLRCLKKMLKFSIGGLTIQTIISRILTDEVYAATAKDSLLFKNLNTVGLDITQVDLPNLVGKYIFWALGAMAILSCLIQIIQCLAEEEFKKILPTVFIHVVIIVVAMMVKPIIYDIIDGLS